MSVDTGVGGGAGEMHVHSMVGLGEGHVHGLVGFGGGACARHGRFGGGAGEGHVHRSGWEICTYSIRQQFGEELNEMHVLYMTV